MARSTHLVFVIVILVGASGCLGITTTLTGPPPSTSVPTAGEPSDGAVTWRTSAVVDHAELESPLIEGGVVSDPQSTEARRYATIVAAPSDRDRIDTAALARIAPDVAAMVNETDLESASLLVYQVTPDSSVPDAQVTSVRRANGTVTIEIDDSAEIATADITVETLIVRLPGDDPHTLVVETEEGQSVASG